MLLLLIPTFDCSFLFAAVEVFTTEADFLNGDTTLFPDRGSYEYDQIRVSLCLLCLVVCWHSDVIQATQPGHPSLGRCNECRWRFWPRLGKKRRVLHSVLDGSRWEVVCGVITWLVTWLLYGDYRNRYCSCCVVGWQAVWGGATSPVSEIVSRIPLWTVSFQSRPADRLRSPVGVSSPKQCRRWTPTNPSATFPSGWRHVSLYQCWSSASATDEGLEHSFVTLRRGLLTVLFK